MLNSVQRILLVDDDVTDRMSIARMLKSADVDIELVEVVDMASGLEQLRTRNFDVALVDYRLPDGTALELFSALNPGGAPRLPVIILTGFSDEKVTREALRFGAEDYLVKGNFDADLLLRSIGYAVERKRGENLRQQLMHADRMAALGELSAGVAHEINGPATFIISNLTLIKDNLRDLQDELDHLGEVGTLRDRPEVQKLVADALDESGVDLLIQECLEMIEDNFTGMKRISSVVRDLGVFSRFDEEEVEMVDVHEVIDASLKLAGNQIKHRAKLVTDFEARMPRIAASAARLSQVFTNLLMNAAQAIPEGNMDGNQVRVLATREDDYLVVRVEDTGVGIAPEDLPRVFDPFFTTRPSGEGTGLGLAICSQIVDAHNGDILVTSTEGVGTNVTVRLPLDTGLLATQKEPYMEDPRKKRLRSRVLIVDDEALMLKSFRRALEPTYEVVTKPDGREALELFENDTDFDVIVCDVMMPHVDGVAIFEEISRRLPHLRDKIVFLSGGGFTDRTKEFLNSVPVPVLEKPVDPETLARVIDEMSKTVGS